MNYDDIDTLRRELKVAIVTIIFLSVLCLVLIIHPA